MDDADYARCAALNRTAGSQRTASLCLDCEPAYRAKMVAEGRCDMLIGCTEYRLHQAQHYRDPRTGGWRCPVCQPGRVPA